MKKRNNKGTKNGCEERGLERERGGKWEREREGKWEKEGGREGEDRRERIGGRG